MFLVVPHVWLVSDVRLHMACTSLTCALHTHATLASSLSSSQNRNRCILRLALFFCHTTSTVMAHSQDPAHQSQSLLFKIRTKTKVSTQNHDVGTPFSVGKDLDHRCVILTSSQDPKGCMQLDQTLELYTDQHGGQCWQGCDCHYRRLK